MSHRRDDDWCDASTPHAYTPADVAPVSVNAVLTAKYTDEIDRSIGAGLLRPSLELIWLCEKIR